MGFVSLCKTSAHLYGIFVHMGNELTVFNQELNTLYEAESYDKPLIVEQSCNERSDIRGFCGKWRQMSETQMNCFYKYFLLTLRYEQEDIKAILEQFKKYDTVYQKYKKSRAFLKKISEKYPERDYSANEQSLSETKSLLDIICKIILVKQTPNLWNAKVEKYNDAVQQYIQT